MKADGCTIPQIYLIKYSTCFGQVRCPSSGVSQHCIHAIRICHASSVGCLQVEYFTYKSEKQCISLASVIRINFSVQHERLKSRITACPSLRPVDHRLLCRWYMEIYIECNFFWPHLTCNWHSFYTIWHCWW